MLTIPVSWQLGQVPPDFCAQGATAAPMWQQVFQLLQSISNLTVSAASSIYPSANTPPSNLQGQVIWLKTTPAGGPLPGWSQFWWDPVYSCWDWPHPPAPFLVAYPGPESALWAEDGGDQNNNNPALYPPTPTTGAMWVAYAAAAFRTLIGAGTNPASYNGQPATVLTQGQTGGEEKHILTPDEMLHQHAIGGFGMDECHLTPRQHLRGFIDQADAFGF